MAADKKTNKGLEAFNAIKGQEIILDRPIVDWDDLDAAGEKMPVQGFLVREEILALPAGAPPRKDGRMDWDAYVVRLTQPTNTIKNGKLVVVGIDGEVFIPKNHKNASLTAFLGQSVMFELVILGEGKIPMPGRNAMQDYLIKEPETRRTLLRTGQFLVGGPVAAALPQGNLGSVINAVSNTPAQHAVS